MTENLKPARLVSPGAILKRELDARGWTQRDLADIMRRPTQAVSEIVQGTKQLTPETAIELAAALGTSAELWTNLEASYRLGLAQRKRDESGGTDTIARKGRLYALAPVKELIKRGWIRNVTALDELEQEVCTFLGISSVEEEPRLAASFRHSNARTPQAGPQLAWLKRVEAVARAQTGKPPDRDQLQDILPGLLSFASAPSGVREAVALLREVGVRVALVKALPQSYVDGVAFALDDGSPVIGLSIRYDRIDHFWFTLLHELAHLVAGHGGAHVDNLDEDRSGSSAEREADGLAQGWLFPPESVDRFIREYRGRISEDAVARFAQAHDRHPGLLVGQLHHRRVVPFQNFRHLLVKVTPYLGDWLDSAAR